MPQYGQQYAPNAAGPIPEGDAFLVQTPEINQTRNMLWQQQMLRQRMQMQQNNQQEEEMARNLSNVRGVDAPEIMQGYSDYKRLRQQALFDPSVRHDANKFNDINNQATQALGDVYSKIDDSKRLKQMNQDLLITQRTHPGTVAPDLGQRLTDFNNTPLSKIKGSQFENPDYYMYKDTVNFDKLYTTAAGNDKLHTYAPMETTAKDKLTNTETTYQYGNNPKQVKESIMSQLAATPNGEQSAANLMENTPQSKIDWVNAQYAAENKDKWRRTTGQEQPMDVEPVGGTKAEQAASYLAKLHWLNSGPQGTSKDVPNKEAITSDKQSFSEQQQQERFQHSDNSQQRTFKHSDANQQKTFKHSDDNQQKTFQHSDASQNNRFQHSDNQFNAREDNTNNRFNAKNPEVSVPSVNMKPPDKPKTPTTDWGKKYNF
jgi:hypothetical protein